MWKTTTTKRRLVIAAIALMGLGLVTARLTFVDPAQAKQAVVLVQKGPVTAKFGDRALLGVMNDGDKPVGVRLMLRSADDFKILDQSAMVVEMVLPRESRFFDVNFDVIGECRFRAGVIVVSAGQPNVAVSLQLFDSLGKTLIFSDGFESGDVTVWSTLP